MNKIAFVAIGIAIVIGIIAYASTSVEFDNLMDSNLNNSIEEQTPEPVHYTVTLKETVGVKSP